MGKVGPYTTLSLVLGFSFSFRFKKWFILLDLQTVVEISELIFCSKLTRRARQTGTVSLSLKFWELYTFRKLRITVFYNGDDKTQKS